MKRFRTDWPGTEGKERNGNLAQTLKYIAYETEGGITAVRFLVKDFCDTLEVRACGDEIIKVYEEAKPLDLIVDFEGLGVVPSSVFANLVLIYKGMHKRGARLRVCSLGKDALSAFYVLNLDRLMTIHANMVEAMAQARASQAAEKGATS